MGMQAAEPMNKVRGAAPKPGKSLVTSAKAPSAKGKKMPFPHPKEHGMPPKVKAKALRSTPK